MTADLQDALGIAETALSPGLAAAAGTGAPPAPWRTRCTVTTWWHPGGRAAADLLPEGLRAGRVRAVAWVLVRYSDTPVGPYSELAAVPVSGAWRPSVHIPFICVDSLPSIAGGRGNWLLPKALASFTWTGDGAAVRPEDPTSPPWSLQAQVRASPLAMPYAMRFGVRQAGRDGRARRFPAVMAGLLHPARVSVDGFAEGPLAGLLRPGRYRGAVLRHGRFRAGPLAP